MRLTVSSSSPFLVLQLSIICTVVTLYIGGRIWAQWSCSHIEPGTLLSGGQNDLDSDIGGVCVGLPFPARLAVNQRECCKKGLTP